jgi:hypothetical protein
MAANWRLWIMLRFARCRDGGAYEAGVDAPPPFFSQVFILKVVKAACFHTLLQVLILKVVMPRRMDRMQSSKRDSGEWRPRRENKKRQRDAGATV